MFTCDLYSVVIEQKHFYKENNWSVGFVFLKRTCVRLELKETKIFKLSTVKGTFPLALSVQFYIMNNSAELQLLPMMESSFNTLPR